MAICLFIFLFKINIHLIRYLGQRFLSGTTFGLEFLNEFCQQTQVLAEYVTSVATKTDDEFMRIKSELEKFKIIMEKRLSEIDKVSKT